jgi:copper transport protein
VFVLLAAVAAAIGFMPGSAAAENTVVTSSPSNGAVLNVSPDAIIIGFAEALGEANTISVDCEAEPVTLPRPEVTDDTTLTVEIATPLPSGTCTARWAVSNSDGEPDGRGVITFVIENDTPTDNTEPSDTAADQATTTTVVTVTPIQATENGTDIEVIDLAAASEGNGAVWLSRLLSTLGIATLFGSLLVITAAWPEGVEYLITIKFLRGVWFLAAIGTLLFVAFGSAAVTPEGGGSPFSPGTWLDLFDAGWGGRALLIRFVLVIASAWVAWTPHRAIDPTTQLAALGIPGIAAALIGVSRTVGDFAALGVVLGVIHALAMSVWVGGVILLARVVLSGPGEEDLVHAVRGFSRVSTPAIVITIVTGLAQMIRLDGGQLFESGHGRVVIIKTIVVAVMIFVAFSARQFVAQRLNRAQQMSVPLADRLRRAFGAEAAIGIVALAMSAWLLAFLPPTVSATPPIDYEVSQTHVDEAELLEVRVRLTDDMVGTLVGLEVKLVEPAANVNGLTVILTAPENDQGIGGFLQPVPLTEAGFAVRDASVGLPISVAGDWTIQVEAATSSGTIMSVAQIYRVQNADGTTATTVVTTPPVSIIEVPITEPPTTEG